jgi:hypothetical protein
MESNLKQPVPKIFSDFPNGIYWFSFGYIKTQLQKLFFEFIISHRHDMNYKRLLSSIQRQKVACISIVWLLGFDYGLTLIIQNKS